MGIYQFSIDNSKYCLGDSFGLGSTMKYKKNPICMTQNHTEFLSIYILLSMDLDCALIHTVKINERDFHFISLTNKE